jgi:hypothetical protein
MSTDKIALFLAVCALAVSIYVMVKSPRASNGGAMEQAPSGGSKDLVSNSLTVAGRNVMSTLDTLAERVAAVEEGAAYKIKFAASCGGYECNQKGSVCLPGRPGAGNDTWVCNGNTWERKTTYGT